MKTLTRYVVAAAGLVTFLVAVKVLLMVPPESNVDHYSERHNKETGVLLWGKRDDHDELSSFGHNNPQLSGEMGRGVVLPAGEKAQGEEALKKYNINVLASDLISLNRQVPDSRPVGCESVKFPDNLPETAIVIPFHNEWPSVLLRTVYSIINRTPKQLLKQIILVDDASDLQSLKEDLAHFIKEHFPANLVQLLRLPERVGLIRARLEGFRHVTAEVVSFFDSHMEVNTDWLQPLLVEILKDRRTVAMGHLDYILPDTFEYSFTPGYRTRYGFDWRLIFFETYFLKAQEKDKDVTDPMPGVVMVGPGFAISADYFREIGMYDDGMKIWGGENLELAWRVWMCGGRLVHLACSKVGHIARPQPYSFPEGRYDTEIHNYKRAIEVWMGPYKQLVYEHHPKMKEIDAGDLTERMALRDRLQCKDFTWYLKNVWPELYPYGENATHWGAVKNQQEGLCLDNDEYLFIGPEKLSAKDCIYEPEKQSFSLTLDHRLRSVLQCVGIQEDGVDMVPILVTCHDEPFHTWTYTNMFQLKHDQTGLCLQLMKGPRLVMQRCQLGGDKSQIWRFEQTGKPHSLANEASANAVKETSLKEEKPQVTKSPRQMLDDFERQLFHAKQYSNDAAIAGAGPRNMMMPDGLGNLMQEGPGIMPGGPRNVMQGGPGNFIPGGPRNMMHGNPGNMMMPGGPQNRIAPGGNAPVMPREGGPMMRGQGIEGRIRGSPRVQNMQVPGDLPHVPVLPRGGAPGHMAKIQGDRGSIPKRMVNMPLRDGLPANKFIQEQQLGVGMMHAAASKDHISAKRGRGQVHGLGGGAGLAPQGLNQQAVMQEMVNRQLYAEAKRAGKAR